MPTNKEIQARKEADIKAEINKLLADRKLKISFVMEQVAQKFYLTVATVQHIYWGAYDTRRARAAERLEAQQQGE